MDCKLHNNRYIRHLPPLKNNSPSVNILYFKNKNWINIFTSSSSMLLAIFKKKRTAIFGTEEEIYRTEPEFVNLLRSPAIDSRPGEIDSLELISWLLKRLHIRAPSTGTVHAICCNSTVLRTSHCEVLFSQVRQKYPAVQCSTESLFQFRCCVLHSMHSTGGWKVRHSTEYLSNCTVYHSLRTTVQYYCPRWSESLTYPAVHWATGSLTQYCTLCCTIVPCEAKVWPIQLYTRELGHLPNTVHSAVLLSSCTLRNWVTYPILCTLLFYYPRWSKDISSCTGWSVEIRTNFKSQ